MYSAWLEPGDTRLLAMDLSHGSHLTHGAPVTRSAQLYNFVALRHEEHRDGRLTTNICESSLKNINQSLLLLALAPTSWTTKFASIGNEVGALLMADMAHIAGLIAGVAKNPF